VTDLGDLLGRHRNRAVLLDTNLFLLLVIGDVDRRQVERWSRTRSYRADDYDVLDRVVRFFEGKIVTTPNVLTEVSNLAAKDLKDGAMKSRFFERLAELISALDEQYVESRLPAGMPNFPVFGLTDLGILRLAKDGAHLVLTDDGRLADYLGRQGVDVLTFSALIESDRRR
jgi:hypothetical protein